MATHDNIHIPGESFPHWIWFTIEFFIVLGIALGIAHQITPALEDVVVSQNWVCIQESHKTNCSQEEEVTPNVQMLIWIFWAIVTAIFFIWYVVIRSWILKKPILRNRS